MIKYELINPSDAIFFEAETHEVATFAVAVFGGKYLANSEDHEHHVPLFMFGGFEKFCLEKFNRVANLYEDEPFALQVAKCLRTFKLAGRRSSMNDITAQAQRLANKIVSHHILKGDTHVR